MLHSERLPLLWRRAQVIMSEAVEPNPVAIARSPATCPRDDDMHIRRALR